MTTTAMTKIKVATATNPQLNWLAAKSQGVKIVRIHGDQTLTALGADRMGDEYTLIFQPATDPAQGWPIVENHSYASYLDENHCWVASPAKDAAPDQNVFGETRLTALLRLHLSLVHGEEAEVPEAMIYEPVAIISNTTETAIPDGDYLLSEGAAWFTVKNFSIRIHSTDEGVVTDIFNKGREAEASVASTYAFDHEFVSN